MKKNIGLVYFLSFAFHSWFWLGNWIYYYLNFGNYAAVALLDSSAVLAETILEIPTGAFADLVGKRKTLMLAFLFQALGNIAMGMSRNYWMLAISLLLFVCLGIAFYSGTMDALVYDSLKSHEDENSYEKHIGRMGAMKLWAMAISGIIGGLIYKFSPGAPYILAGIVGLMGFVACFWLEEPKVDTDKYSLLTFFKQNTKGIVVLFSGGYIKKLSFFLVITGAFSVIITNILDDLLAVEFGFDPLKISLLFSAACLVAGGVSIYYPKFKRGDVNATLVFSMILTAGTLIISPTVGMVVGGLMMFFRIAMEVIYENASTVEINKYTESNVRATTLSSLSLLRSLPYALGGGLFGLLIQIAGGARNFSVWFGVVLILLTLILGLNIRSKQIETNG